ncbi:MAG: universal stress protein [Microbacteriaceae bacterium]
MFSRILVPIDATAHSGTVLAQARELAILTGASVHLLHLNVSEWVEGQELIMEDTESTRQFVDQALLSFTTAGIRATAEILPADSRDIGAAIVQHVIPGPEQLIVIGARHHPAWLGLLGGSVSDQVARLSACPVLLVP